MVPLSNPVLDILKELELETGEYEYVFTSPMNCRSVVSENTFLFVLCSIGDNFSHMYYDAKLLQWISKLRYSYSVNAWCFENIEDVIIKSEIDNVRVELA